MKTSLIILRNCTKALEAATTSEAKVDALANGEEAKLQVLFEYGLAASHHGTVACAAVTRWMLVSARAKKSLRNS